MDGDIGTIYVNPTAWVEATDDDKRVCEAAAGALGIELEIGGGEAVDTLVVAQRPKAGGSPTELKTVSYAGSNACGRGPWQHALRQVLELGDPGFSGA